MGKRYAVWFHGYESLSAAEAGRLAVRAGEGDSSARERLALSVGPAIVRLAADAGKKVGRPDLTDEFALAAVADFWERCHAYDPAKSSPVHFASVLARNVFADVTASLAFPARLPLYLVESSAWRDREPDATKRAADAARAEVVSAGRRPGECGVDVAIEAEDIASAIDRKDILSRLCSYRHLLTRRERRALALRYRVGLNLKEAGLLMGISYQAAQQAETRAIARLRKALNVQVAQ